MYCLLTLFLSRLCGGEGFLGSGSGFGGFLSRLCGGEVGMSNFAQAADFLSRLCGGEVRCFCY